MQTIKIDVFADGAEIEQMQYAYDELGVDGFTTNPSLMKKAGIKDYNTFAKEVVDRFPNSPISFEVFSDEFDQMKLEARKLARLGENVFVKIPISNSKGESSIPLIHDLSEENIKLNVTAIFTLEQVKDVVNAVKDGVDTIISVFAGRIADTGVNPIPIMEEAAKLCQNKESVKLLWASPREVLNIVQAEEAGVDIITCTPDLIKKTKLFGKDLEEYSRETVQGFLNDSKSLGFTIL
ncbi:transaldolase [Aerococcus tenax]|uniref:transaldolase n=1 Tax=Aerococcus tenax TaxID=3078812 RepID=UPI0018A747CF|nr:transaldolase [Aerococcus tenax]